MGVGDAVSDGAALRSRHERRRGGGAAVIADRRGLPVANPFLLVGCAGTRWPCTVNQGHRAVLALRHVGVLPDDQDFV